MASGSSPGCARFVLDSDLFGNKWAGFLADLCLKRRQASRSRSWCRVPQASRIDERVTSLPFFGGDRRGEFPPATWSEGVESGSGSDRQEELRAARGVEQSSLSTSTTRPPSSTVSPGSSFRGSFEPLTLEARALSANPTVGPGGPGAPSPGTARRSPWAEFGRRLGPPPRSVAVLDSATLAAPTAGRVTHRAPWAEKGPFSLPPPSFFASLFFDAHDPRLPVRSGANLALSCLRRHCQESSTAGVSLADRLNGRLSEFIWFGRAR